MARNGATICNVSITGACHERLVKYCESLGLNRRRFVDRLINDFLDADRRRDLCASGQEERRRR